MSPELKKRLEAARREREARRRQGIPDPEPTKEWSKDSLKALTQALSGKTIK